MGTPGVWGEAPAYNYKPVDSSEPVDPSKPCFSTQGAPGVWGGAPACKYINRPVDSLVNPLTPRKPISTLGGAQGLGLRPSMQIY